jgi:quercetin dioxygenase-like cupin family protein
VTDCASLPSILKLIEVIQTHLQQRALNPDDAGKEAAKVLSLMNPLPLLEGTFTRSNHPSTCYLEAAFAAGNTATEALISAIRPIALDFPWRYSYAKRDDAPGLEDRMAFAEIIGPEAPFKTTNLCVGLTLIGPLTFYPPHAHPAIELYLVAAGTAIWTAGENSGRYVPGAFILHPSRIVHAMRTQKEPLLAVYFWSGEDVETLSTYTSS